MLFTWDGRLIGNHHCGSVLSPVKVDVLKGVNLSFRRQAFPSLQIDTALESFGAEVCWEIDICLSIKRNGYIVLYDNDNFVYHYASRRSPNDSRMDLYSESKNYRAYNQAFITAKYRPFFEVLFALLRAIFIGSKIQPGILYAIRLSEQYGLKVYLLPFHYSRYVLKGMKEGLKARRKASL